MNKTLYCDFCETEVSEDDLDDEGNCLACGSAINAEEEDE